MIATIQHAVSFVIDFFRFVIAVWRDARAMQNEAEDKYGMIGF